MQVFETFSKANFNNNARSFLINKDKAAVWILFARLVSLVIETKEHINYNRPLSLVIRVRDCSACILQPEILILPYLFNPHPFDSLHNLPSIYYKKHALSFHACSSLTCARDRKEKTGTRSKIRTIWQRSPRWWMCLRMNSDVHSKELAAFLPYQISSRLRSKKTKTIIDTKLLLSFFSLSSTKCNLKFNSWLVRSVIVRGAKGDAIKYR